MANCYRAIINLDYSHHDSNEYQKLQAALIQAGWMLVETSAYTIEACDIRMVWRGIELIAKYNAKVGDLSALTYHIQGSDDFTTGKSPKSLKNHSKALKQIQAKPFPSI